MNNSGYNFVNRKYRIFLREFKANLFDLLSMENNSFSSVEETLNSIAGTDDFEELKRLYELQNKSHRDMLSITNYFVDCLANFEYSSNNLKSFLENISEKSNDDGVPLSEETSDDVSDEVETESEETVDSSETESNEDSEDNGIDSSDEVVLPDGGDTEEENVPFDVSVEKVQNLVNDGLVNVDDSVDKEENNSEQVAEETVEIDDSDDSGVGVETEPDDNESESSSDEIVETVVENVNSSDGTVDEKSLENLGDSLDVAETGENTIVAVGENVTNDGVNQSLGIDLPVIDSLANDKVNDSGASDKQIFVVEGDNAEKAILVSVAQGGKLRASRKEKEVKFVSLTTNTSENTPVATQSITSIFDSEPVADSSQIESLMEKANQLYKEGDTAQAQALYDQISVLNKQLQQANSDASN